MKLTDLLAVLCAWASTQAGHGVVVLDDALQGSWKPAGRSVRLGASPRRDPTAGAPVGAVFSNVKLCSAPN